MDDVTKRLKTLEREVHLLKTRRIYQADIIPGSIKNRAMGEPNSYVYSGLAADRPTEGAQVTLGVSIYFATDTGELSIWDGTQWLSVTLT